MSAVHVKATSIFFSLRLQQDFFFLLHSLQDEGVGNEGIGFCLCKEVREYLKLRFVKYTVGFASRYGSLKPETL